MTAALTTATLPLHSCRIRHLRRHFGPVRFRPVNGYAAWLRTAIEANSATSAVLALVLRRMNSILIEIRRQLQDFGGTRVHTKAAALAFLSIEFDVTSNLISHDFLWCLNTQLTRPGPNASARVKPLPGRGGVRRRRAIHFIALEPARAHAMLVQLVAERRMRNADEQFRPLPHAFSE